MYEYIRGTLSELAPTHAVVEASGVGYLLNISLETFSAIEHAAEVRLFVHYIVREDAQLFYGFATKAERELFRLLLGVFVFLIFLLFALYYCYMLVLLCFVLLLHIHSLSFGLIFLHLLLSCIFLSYLLNLLVCMNLLLYCLFLGLLIHIFHHCL